VNRAFPYALAGVLAFAGCGTSNGTPGAAPRTAAADTTRQACHTYSANPAFDVTADDHFDPTVWVDTAQAAAGAKDPGVSTAGGKLRDVVAANEQLAEDDRQGRPNVDLEQALINMARACSTLYGDGPW
jgi:hypothetical protein